MFKSKFSGPDCRFDCKHKCPTRSFSGTYGYCQKAAEALADYIECDCRGNEEWIVAYYQDEFEIKSYIWQIMNFLRRGRIKDTPWSEFIDIASICTRLAAFCLLSEKYGSSDDQNQLYETIQRSFRKR